MTQRQFNEQLGRNLAAARHAAGFRTISEVSKIYGVNQTSIDRCEKGEGALKLWTLARLARCYGVSLDTLAPTELMPERPKELLTAIERLAIVEQRLDLLES